MAIGTLAAIGLGLGAVGSIASGVMGADAASSAANAQSQSSAAAIAEQRAAREQLAQRLAPYEAAGQPALTAQMNALGLNGAAAQQAYVQGQEQSPLYQALAKQGEDAMLQNASATGGLRGGNMQGALAQFRPALLNQFLEQQYNRLGGMTSLGQQSAAGVGTAGMQSANSISDLLAQQGQAQAGAALAAGKAWSQPFNFMSGLGGMAFQKGIGF